MLKGVLSLQKQSFEAFVETSITTIEDFDSERMSDIRQIIELALNYYALTSSIRDKNELWIESIVEETILSKITELATGQDLNIEAVFNGQIVRNY